MRERGLETVSVQKRGMFLSFYLSFLLHLQITHHIFFNAPPSRPLPSRLCATNPLFFSLSLLEFHFI